MALWIQHVCFQWHGKRDFVCTTTVLTRYISCSIFHSLGSNGLFLARHQVKSLLMSTVGMLGITCRGLTRLQSPAGTQWTSLSLSWRTWEESKSLCFYLCCVFDCKCSPRACSASVVCVLSFFIHLSLPVSQLCMYVWELLSFPPVVDCMGWSQCSIAVRLREKCEPILLLSCSYRRKTEELLWKKAFYEVVQRCKMHKQVGKSFPSSFCLPEHSMYGYAPCSEACANKLSVTSCIG